MRAVGKGLEGIDFCNCIVVKIKAVMLLLIGAVSEHKIEGRVFRVIFHYVNCRSESFCLLRLSPFGSTPIAPYVFPESGFHCSELTVVKLIQSDYGFAQRLGIVCAITAFGTDLAGIVAPSNEVLDAYSYWMIDMKLFGRGCTVAHAIDTVEKVLDVVQIGELGFVHIWIPFSSGNMSHYRHACGRSG